MENKKITIMVKNANKFPFVMEVENDLSVFQDIVGGYIEVVKIANGLDLVVNESGLIDELPVNFTLTSHGQLTVFGNCFFTGVDYRTGEFVSLSDEAIENLTEMFLQIEDWTA